MPLDSAPRVLVVRVLVVGVLVVGISVHEGGSRFLNVNEAMLTEIR